MFTLQELEKNPNARVSSTSVFILPPPGTVAWDDEELKSSENYKTVIDDIKQVVNQRRLDCWPPFKDYDKYYFLFLKSFTNFRTLNYLSLFI